MNTGIMIRTAGDGDFETLGNLMTEVYSELPGFPSQEEQPDYYAMLQNVGRFSENPGTTLIVAETTNGRIIGGVVYFKDMQYYGSGGSAAHEKETSGFRLLAVHHDFRGAGLGRALTEECIRKAKRDGNKQVIIHTTEYMRTAWKLYERMGFHRSQDLDFTQGSMPVFGFRFEIVQKENQRP